jgi:hypothetical protein
VAIPVLVKERLHSGAGSLGLVMGSLGAGGLLALLIRRFGPGPRRTVTMYVSWVGSGVAMAGAGAFAVLGSVAGFMAVGLALAFGNTIC